MLYWSTHVDVTKEAVGVGSYFKSVSVKCIVLLRLSVIYTKDNLDGNDGKILIHWSLVSRVACGVD